MDKINETKTENKEQCEIICNKEGEFVQNDLDLIEKIIAQDNTEPIFILAYLKVIKHLKKQDFKNQIAKYIFFLSKELIKKNFPEYLDMKESSSEMFEKLYENILKSSFDSKNVTEKIFFHNSLTFFDKNCVDIKGFTDYNKNKELSIYFLVKKVKEGIIKRINKIEKFIINDKDQSIKMLQKMKEEAKVFQRVDDFNKNKTDIEPSDKEKEIYEYLIKINKNYNAEQMIKDADNRIIFISKLDSQDFALYMENYASFLSAIKKEFKARFNDIENLSESDFELFRKFCLFLQYYNFNDSKLNFYIKKWKNTFTQNENYILNAIKMNQNANFYEYDQKNNILTFKQIELGREKIIIKKVNNVNKYCIDCVLSYFNEFIHDNYIDIKNIDISKFQKVEKVINEYLIEHLLKFDSVKSTYIYQKWDILEEYLLKIFTSETIKSAFRQICKELNLNEPFDFINEKDLKFILNRSNIFQFNTSVMGVTESIFFMIFIYYRGIIPYYDENCSKLLNLNFYQVTQEHEILGHLNIKLQNYFANKEISSPIVSFKDKTGDTKFFKESGEFIEKLLYGRVLSELTYNESLFILDIKNYDVDCQTFRNNFLNCNKTTYKISDSLSNLLKSLDISVSNAFKQYEPFIINKDLAKKIPTNNDLHYYHQRHYNIDLRKEAEFVQKLINDLKNYEKENLNNK